MVAAIKRLVMVILFISFISLGCGGSNESSNTESGKYPEGDIQEFVWETDGGGDILFSITPDNNEFKIVVSRYDFESVDVTIYLSETELDVYNLVEDIFNKTINIYDYTFTPEGGETGSWTTITLVFSESQILEIENIQSWSDDLSILKDFVEENTEPIASVDSQGWPALAS